MQDYGKKMAVIAAAEVQPGVRNKIRSIYYLFSVHLDLLSMSTMAFTESRKGIKPSNTICHPNPSQNDIIEILSNIQFPSFFFFLAELQAPPGTI